MKRMFASAGFAIGLAISPVAILAQDYAPDVIEMSGDESLAFEPAEQIDLSSGGAIEFWVAPAWEGSLDHDAPVVVNAGEEGVSYLISVLRDRDGLVFANNEAEAVFAFDLTDGQLHHVTINVMEDGIVAYVDGKLVGTSDVRPMALPSSGLFVGGLTVDGAHRFNGAIGQLRIWGEPLFEEDIEDYRLIDILNANGDDHPDIANLKAISDFSTGELLLVEEMEELP